MAKLLFDNFMKKIQQKGKSIRPEDLVSLFGLSQKASLKVVDDIKASYEPVNILIAGKTGIGKSTLINSVFREELATTGIGKPVTQHLQHYQKKHLPLRVYDTKGLELMTNSQEKVIEGIIQKVKQLYVQDKSQHVHAIWYGINAQGRRIEDVELGFIRKLSELAPVIIVLTQYYGEVNAEFLRYLEEMNLPVYCVHPILAKDFELAEGQLISHHGVEELVQLKEDILPEYAQQAFTIAQKVNIEMKVAQAQKIADKYVLAAASVSASPLPFADATALMSIQVVMLLHLTVSFGISVSQSLLLGLSSSLLGSQGAKMIGKYLSTSLGKLIPGGNVAAILINSSIAKQITKGLAQTYIKVLEQVATLEKAGQIITEEELLTMTKRAFTKKEEGTEEDEEPKATP